MDVDAATRAATWAGLVGAAPVGAGSAAVVLAAHKLWPAFAKGLGASGKVSCIIIPPFFAFVLYGEHSINLTKRQNGGAR
ncbi:hypothetical protein M885DRAFT_513335 [Pelagophyceae sp. CCMP2097]|nr:hypothetical protein M885DRAFT_513335 [Pelagophyceae sp. CCMP2097]